jgi:hypothetical protein
MPRKVITAACTVIGVLATLVLLALIVSPIGADPLG